MSFLAVAMGKTYQCGTLDFQIPGEFPYIVHLVILLIKIVVPVLLIIFGMLDLAKAVIASKEEEIKKGQQTLIKRIVAAVIVFFVVQLVQIIISFVASGSDGDTITDCFACFVNGTTESPSSTVGCREVN